ncbi:MAG: ComEC/Rec2 family competence protein [Candidatus Moranbacteria bacterium]|nr:ComEC/Rec2 family competence protein [Candidatus Moranbacteria bacterium]
MTKSRVFFILASSFLFGVFTASFFLSVVGGSLLLILTAVAVAIFILNPKNQTAIVISAAVLFFTLGLWRTENSINNAKYNLANDRIGPAEFQAVVIREPETGEKVQKVVVEDGKKGKILLNADIFPKYEYGDRLQVSCILAEPKNFDEKFDYRMYLAKDKIYRLCSRPQITGLGKSKGGKIYSAILAVKNKFEASLSAVFPDPEGAYLKGLLLGGSNRMTGEFSDAFSRTGTTHTVAVSGYNVTIVAAFLMEAGILMGLWRQQVFSFALLGIIFFVLATGSPASAVRAGIMGSLVIWAMKEGRLANSQNAILAAAGVMLAFNPLLLRYDAGFQLSFLATLGIVYLSPAFEKYFEKAGKISLIKESLFLSIAAQIFVLPVILNSFENLSVISPLANLLILPAIPYIMLGGFAAGIAGFVFAPLGKIIGFLPYILLKFELFIVQWLANIPWASLEIKNFGWKQIAAYYTILSGFLFWYYGKNRIKIKPADEK